MAVLYTFIVNNPNWDTVPPFPPSVEASDWLRNLVKDAQSRGFVVSGRTTSFGNQFIIFETESELNVYLSANKLTDPTLIADLNTWKTAHNIKFINKAYSVSSTDITIIDPLFG